MLSVREAGYSYGGALGIAAVTFEAQPGELIALTGSNGSGKSTFLKLAARVLSPTSGDVFFENRSLRDWRPKEYARNVAYLPQEPDTTFAMRAIDVVVSGRAPYLTRFGWEGSSDYAAAAEALEMCDAGHLSDRFLDEMSGGERKRIFLARALVRRPQLVLLDEPLASLDLAHVQHFSTLMRQVVERTRATVIFAAHDLNWAAAYSDRVLVMKNGALAADLNPSELMQPDRIRELFDVEAATVMVNGKSWLVPL